ELSAMLEQECDTAVLAEIAAVLGQRVADLGHGALAVVGHAVDQDSGTAGPVALVADFLEVGIVGASRAALDGAQDVVLGHVGRSGLVPSEPQAGIGVRVGPTVAGGNGDFTNDFGPELAALGVLSTLAVLDVCPFTVSGHNKRQSISR